MTLWLIWQAGISDWELKKMSRILGVTTNYQLARAWVKIKVKSSLQSISLNIIYLWQSMVIVHNFISWKRIVIWRLKSFVKLFLFLMRGLWIWFRSFSGSVKMWRVPSSESEDPSLSLKTRVPSLKTRVWRKRIQGYAWNSKKFTGLSTDWSRGAYVAPPTPLAGWRGCWLPWPTCRLTT